MKKRSVLFSAVLSTALLFAGCSGGGTEAGGSSAAPKKEGNNVTIAVNANFISLDPHNTGDTLSISGTRSMYQALMGFDKDMKLIPVLAESYEISSDSLVYTFKLRQNVKFHDGTPFDAEAVKVNFERLKDEKNNLRLKRSALYVDKVEVVDDSTVKLILSQPYSAMLNKVAMINIISPKALQEYGKDITQHPVGTGPYKFKEWVQGDRLTVEKNPHYWEQGVPKVDSITFKPVPENGSRIAMLKTGEADFIYPFPTEQVEQTDGKDGITVEKNASTIARYISINSMKKPFDDVRVRQALNYAVNKDAYVKVVKQGYGEKLDSLMSSKTQYYAQQQAYEFNVEKAKELLKEAGYPDGFKAEIWGNTDSETQKGMQFVEQQLAQIGVTLDVKPMEEATLSEEINAAATPQDAKVQMWYVSWSPSSADADAAIRPLFSTEMFPPKGANTAYYSNPTVDELLVKANKSANVDEQKQLYGEVQGLVYKDAPWIFLGVDEVLAGKKGYLNGVYMLPDGSISVREAEIKQ